MTDILARCSGWRWWGWVVTFFVFVELFIIFGPLYNFSILFVSLRKEFKSSAALTGSVGSLGNGLVYFFSPIAGLLLRRFNSRAVVMSGVVVYSLGLFTTSFVPNIGLAFLTFGILPAFGAGLLMHIGPRLLFEWFPKKHNVRAVCLGVLGTSAGMLSIAPVMNILIIHYGWRTTLKLLSGGSLLIGLIGGIFLSPPPARRRQSVRSSLSVDPTTTPTPDALATITPLQADDNREANLMVDKGTDVFCEESCLETEVDENEQEIPTNGDDDIRERMEKKDEIIEEMDCRTKGVTQALRSANAWLYSSSVIFAMISWTFVIINMASFMKDLGFSTDQTSLVLIIIGIGEIAGKVVTALCGDHLPFLQICMFAASSILGAVAAGFMIFANSMTDMIILSVGVLRGTFFGFGFSAGFELFGESYKPDTTTNVLIIPWGLGFLIGAPLSGGLFDMTGNYTLSLLVLIGSFVLSAACAVMVSIRKNLRSLNCYRRSVDKENQDDLNKEEGQHSTKAGTVNEAYDSVMQ